MFGEPARTPQDEATRIHPLNPYGAAKAYAHLMVDVYRSRDLHASSLVLYNHESPRRPIRFVTRKITSTVAAISRGYGRRADPRQPRRPSRLGGAPDYTDAMMRAARAERAGDYVIATGESHSVRDFVAAAFTHVGITDWEPLVGTDPAFVRPADSTDLVGDPGKARRHLAWPPPSPSPTSSPAWSTRISPGSDSPPRLG